MSAHSLCARRLAVEFLEARDCPAGDGLSAVYFDSPDLSRARELTGPAVARLVPTVNFNWGSGAPVAGVGADTFAARFAGRVEAVETGTYTFRTRSDDGVRLWVDGKLVIDNWTNHSPAYNTAAVTLEAGRRYDVTLEYYENTGGAVLTLEWKRPGQTAFGVIPQAQLYSMRNTLPADGNYLDVKAFGAVGDGVADDTAAIRAAIFEAVSDGGGRSRYSKPQFVYLPAGTYRVTDTIEGKGDPGWSNGWRAGVILVGEGRDATTIRLDNSNPLFGNPAAPKAVIKTGSENNNNSAPDGGGNRAFRNSVLHLTVDTGRGNPGAMGIDYLASNRGTVEHVRIRSGDGAGVAGLAMDRPWPGPALVKHVSVEGFDYGVSMRSHYQYGMTFEHLRLVGQRAAGILTNQNVLHIRGLRSDNTVPAVRATGNNNQITLIDSVLAGGAAAEDAVFTAGYLLARNVTTSGYGTAIDSEGGLRVDVPGGPGPVYVGEYLSHSARSLFPSPAATLNLPIEETPEFYTADLSRWANVEAFGATRNNSADDDSAAIQAAIDSGAEIVYLPSGTYHLGGTIVIRGNVKKIIGLQSAIAARSGSTGVEIRFEGGAGDVTILEHLDLGVRTVHAGAGTLAIRHADFGSVGVASTPEATGKLFLEDTIGRNIRINGPLTVWGRQVNAEFGDLPLIENNGGTLWILGLKTEGEMTVIKTVGGTTELLGALIYPLRAGTADRPLFVNEESRVSLTYMINGSSNYPVQVRETRGGVTLEQAASGFPRRVVLYTGYEA